MARITGHSAVLLLCALSIGVIVTGCAKEGIPPGGPVDTEAPAIVEISPEPRSINVHTATPIVFHFSEAMNHESVERAIFFTPDIGSTFRYYWRGREFHLDPMVPYRENTTIVVTVGADASDQRRNRLGTSVTLAFSTGARLDDATITGAVLRRGEFVRGAWIWIYPIPADPLSAVNADPSPFLPLEEVQPLYITQADDRGRFRQSYIAGGMYRVFAFKDSDGNRRWDRESDPLAVPPTSVGFSAPGEIVEGLMLNLAPRDTTGPSLSSATAPNRDYVRVRFSEPPAPGSVPRVAFEISVEEGMEPQSAPAVTILRSWNSWEAPASITYQVDGIAAEQRYRVTLLEMVDAQGNPGMASSRPVIFTAPSQPDTAHPLITAVVPGDSTRTLNRDQTIRLTFTTEIETGSVTGWFLSGPDSTGSVDLDMNWLDPRTLDLKPAGTILPDVFYHLAVPAGSLTSWTGISGPVEDQTFAWQGIRERGRGTLHLTVEGDVLPAGGVYRIFIEGLGSGTTPLTILDFATQEEFITPELLEGPYRVWGYADVNGDGVLDAGHGTPYRPAETVGAISDTLYVMDSFESVYGTPLILRPARLVTEEEIPPR